mgnify:CR=1 FL=1
MSSCRILVMDPSPTVRRVVQLALGRQGHDVLATGMASEAADWLVREDLEDLHRMLISLMTKHLSMSLMVYL